MPTKTFSRFATPTRLTGTTRVMGVTAKQWDDALTGDMVKTLQIVKKKVQAIKHTGDSVNGNLQHIPSGDLASGIKHRKTSIAR